MKNLFILLATMLCNTCLAQAPYIQWQKCLGGTAGDYGRSILQTADSCFVIAAKAGSTDGDVTGNHGPLDYWIVKMSPTGTIIWKKCYGGSLPDHVQYITQTSDGGFICAGSTVSNDGDVSGNHGIYDFWIVKLSDTGRLEWAKTLGGSGRDFGHFVQQTSDGGYIVTGCSDSHDGDVTGNHGNMDVWVVRLSATGNIIWEKSFGGSADDIGGAGFQTPDGGFLISGITASSDGDVTFNHGGDDVWVLKLSDTGRLEWQKTYGGSMDDDVTDETEPGAMQMTPDGGCILAGWSKSTDGDLTLNHGSFDFWVLKISDTGRLVWQKSFGGTGDDEATSIDKTSDGGYVVAGITSSNNGDVSGNLGGDDFWVVKISDTGHLQWQKCMGGTGYSPANCANSVHQTLGGGYIVAGYSNANTIDVSGNHGDYDAWVVKLNCVSPSAAPLTGDSVLCAGASISLSDTSSGGAWRVSNSHASVSGGVVSGLSAGTDTVQYVVANTCGAAIATHVVTINPLPAPLITASGVTLSVPAGYVSYQWFFNATPVPGATNAVYTATLSGGYSVVVTDGNGCTGTSAIDTFRNLGLSGQSAGVSGPHIYPNPANSRILITGLENPEARLYNQTGQLVKHGSGNELNISELPSGVYFITVSDVKRNTVLREKIIRQ